MALYIQAEFNDELRWRCYVGDLLWVRGIGSTFTKTNAPKEAQKYITTPTYQRWHEVMFGELEQTQRIATDEDLNEILYGDRNFQEQSYL